METFFNLLGLLVLAVVVYFIYGLVHTSVESARTNREIRKLSERYRESSDEETARGLAAIWLRLRDSVPYVPTPEVADYSPGAIAQAVARTLGSLPLLGTWAEGADLPVPLPPERERRRHLYIVGKTGAGKTTLLSHLVGLDLGEGRGVGVVSPEGEIFRERLLPLAQNRRDELVYFAPGDPGNRITFNPLAVEEGDDPARSAEDLFTIFRRTIGDEIGPRSTPILQNAFAALVGREEATLADLKRLLGDEVYREEVAFESKDEYVRSFLLDTFPRFPKGAELPLVSRLDAFLRPPSIRRTLCRASSTLSIREIVREGKVLYVDLSGLSEEARLLLGQMLLSKFGIELLRRERGASRRPFYLYADEFQTFGGQAPGTWRELLSRGRKYGLGLTLANQYPAQLPLSLQDEIFGNVASLVSFTLGAKDAQVVRRELLVRNMRPDGEVVIEPIEASELLELRRGEAIARLAGGKAIRVRTPPPAKLDTRGVEALIRHSWSFYGAPEEQREDEKGEAAAPRVKIPLPAGAEDFLE